MSGINSRLSVEFRRVRDFEQHIFHDIRAKRHLELKLFTLGFSEEIPGEKYCP